MPHNRKRVITNTLIKKLKLWPAVGLVGARQTGKSFLLQQLLPHYVPASYFSLDSKTDKDRATRAPDAFSEPQKNLLIIDEVQKVPDLFDSIKLHIDRSRRPGKYLITGSTEFSQFTGIRESLTGRMGLIHLNPLTLNELYDQSDKGIYFSKSGSYNATIRIHDFEKSIERGGMPAFCFLRSSEEFEQSCQMWIETTCFRDLNQILKKGFDGELAFKIISTLATLEEPTSSNVSSKINKDARIVTKYLDAFTRIFVLRKISPHSTSKGKPHYVIFDSGLANYLGANQETLLRSHVLNEALTHFEVLGSPPSFIEYFSTYKKSYLPIILRWANKKQVLALTFGSEEAATALQIGSMQSFKNKISTPCRQIILNHCQKSHKDENIEVHPLR